MRRYETIFVLRPDLGENQLKQSVKRIEDVVTNGGELIETDEWGMRELAYRIKRERRGYYVRLDYVAAAAVMNEVERNLKLMDEALRYLSVMVEEEPDVDHLRGEVEARQRRLDEARAAAAAGQEHPPAEPAAGEGINGEPPAAEEPQAADESLTAQTPASAAEGESDDTHTEAKDGADQN